ncbi:hypothetical protein JL721_3593 [Aureococcus anophagefferens]|nr:hypothetical protein JL721_3593 [Aureococcus anophagefferens]
MSLNAEARRAERECLTFRRRANYETVPPLSNADKPRLQPVKVDPKVFFANERTFLAWIHMALLLGGMAIGIIGFARRGPACRPCPRQAPSENRVYVSSKIVS